MGLNLSSASEYFKQPHPVNILIIFIKLSPFLGILSTDNGKRNETENLISKILQKYFDSNLLYHKS